MLRNTWPLSFMRPPPVGTIPSSLNHLFTGGEIGDHWVFDAANTDGNASGDPVTVATGLVNALVLEDADPANQPNLNAALTGTVFTAPSDRLFHNFAAGTVAQPGTIIISMNSGSSLSAKTILTGSAAGSRWQISVDGSNNIIGFAGSSLDSTRNNPVGTKVLTFVANGASSRFRVNGEGVNSDVTGNGGTQGTNRLTVGALYDGTGGIGMTAYSALFINRVLTAGELDGAERLIGSYAGLSW